MKFRPSYIFLLIVLASLYFVGLDFTHHAHNSWLYYQMIDSWDYMSTDPYFGSQITYAYGVPAYALAGVLWFVFGIHSISVLLGIFTIINYIVLRKWFKSEKWINILIFINLFFTIYDAYIAAFSNCLFWVAAYAYYNKKNWWPIPLLIAAFNHPYVLLSAIFFAIQTPSLIAPLSIILSFFIIASKVFTEGIYMPIYTVFMGLARIVINFLPLMVLAMLKQIKIKNLSIFEKISSYKVTIPTLLIVLLIMVPLGVTLAIYILVLQPINSVDFTMFEGIPEVNGTMRVIDYLYLPSVYVLPHEGFILEAGSFRENNPQHMIKTIWENDEEYSNFMQASNISYILFCKMCNPQSNEKDILEEYHSLIWENDYYYLYSVN